MVYDSILRSTDISKMVVRTDTQSIELSIPETGQLFTTLRYTLSPVQDVNVSVSGSAKVSSIESQNFVGDPNMAQNTTVQYYDQTGNIISTADFAGKEGDNINTLSKMPDGYNYISGPQNYIFQRDQKQNVVVVIAKNQANTVKVNYYDQNGIAIKDNNGNLGQTLQGNNGQSWDFSNSIPQIDGYQYYHVDQINPNYKNNSLSGNYSQVGPTELNVYYKKIGQVVFHFVDDNGNAITTNDGHSSFTWNGVVGSDWNYNDWVPEINGYRYDHVNQFADDATKHSLNGQYYSFTDNVYLVYEPSKVTNVTFYFHDQNGNAITTNDGHSSFTWSGLSGSTWDYSKWVPQIDGYQYSHDDVYDGSNVYHTLNGKYSTNDISVYLTYDKNENVNFYFHDQDGNAITTNDGHSSFTWLGGATSPWNYTSWVPEINGYQYSHVDQYLPNGETHDLFGNYSAFGDTNVYLTYQRVGTVNFYFHDQNGNAINTNDGHSSFSWTGNMGTSWNYNDWIPEINGFTYNHADQYNPTYFNHDLTGNYPLYGPTNVYLTYDQIANSGRVNVHYHDQDGKEIKPSIMLAGQIATPWDYTSSVPTIDGYTYDHADQYNPTYFDHDLTGNYPLYGPTDLYLTYVKNDVVNVYYHDEKGNTIKPQTSITGEQGTNWDYTNSIPAIDGYYYNHADQYSSVGTTHNTNGTYTSDSDNLYLTYNTDNSQLHVSFVDSDTGKYLDPKYDLNWYGKYGNGYDISNAIPVIKGLKYSYAINSSNKSSSPLTGTYNGDNTWITVYMSEVNN
ncbi:MucBP domain-containing protein [Fructilactobacillus sp. Tb1]|uniref:MucBP domain-containing protein n=1 Tax=Fructilactobacillus sp. Tb1 TaxID=3422304 RepID=UPI003D2DA285